VAADVTSPEPEPKGFVPLEPVAAAAPPQSEEMPHRFGFLLLYGILGLALGATMSGLVLAFNAKLTTGGPPWSTWRPTGGGIGAAQQIAEHVGGEYRLANGDQLVDVIAKAPSVTAGNTTIPVGYVAVRGKRGATDQLFPVSGSNSVMYTLCGLGPSCTIATGKASVARGRLVRREILELALYTFHTVGGADNVLALMPPSSATKPPVLVYLRRGDLGPELRLPLGDSLGAQVPKPGSMPPRERQLVDATTGSRAYSFSLTRAQDGNAILILAPLAA
jgi:hypothetical protein